MKLDLKPCWSYFCRWVQKIGPRDPNFWPPSESKIQDFDYFVQVKRFPWIHISLTLYAHWSYFQRFVQYGPQRPNFWTILDPTVCKNTGLSSLSQKVFTSFTSVLLHMLIASTFRCVENHGLQRSNFWVPKQIKIPVFGHFLKKISTGFASVLVYF